MTATAEKIDDLDKDALARLLLDMFHRIVVHYGFWFNEVRHQLGHDKALDVLQKASRRSMGIQLKRLGKVLGYDMHDGLPEPLRQVPVDTLRELVDAVAANWLANDGVWFQAVEFDTGMNDAKRCNDSCWAQFSPFEARAVKEFLGLPAEPGLEGLKKALQFRLYAGVNVQSIVEEGADSFVFQMNDCRVQAARRRKGLDDYPCKSGGLVEYTYFARAIDARIRTECIGCPPDPHPADWFCAWRFRLAG
jgi:hypothetical protein